jgi:hypothetical protein
MIWGIPRGNHGFVVEFLCRVDEFFFGKIDLEDHREAFRNRIFQILFWASLSGPVARYKAWGWKLRSLSTIKTTIIFAP